MKAILVIDMPTDCIKCPLADGYCWNAFPTKGRADGCPLRPLPQKKMPKQGEAFPQDVRLIDRWRGWDACIDEIMGETK